MDNLIKTTRKVVPMIYAYTTPGVTYHDGYIKVGETEQDVEKRVWQQTHTAGIDPKIEWRGQAVFDDGSGKVFKDTDFHTYMRKNGIKQPMDVGNPHFAEDDKNEWFLVSPEESHKMFIDFRQNKGIQASDTVEPYTLRKEQEQAVEKTVGYFNTHDKGEFLWNAKPRFGKTLSTYDLAKRLGAQKVLIVTNRPAIANSWYQDYERFVGNADGCYFVSGTDSLKDKKYVMSYAQYVDMIINHGDTFKCLFYFVSLQDLKGSVYFGGQHNKLSEIANINGGWDLLVIDEAHEGVDTYKTDVAFNQIIRKHTLHLSGTPFKAIANDKFSSDAIFNWTYSDEQKAKAEWDDTRPQENPYAVMPTLKMLTYKMSDAVREKLEQGADFNDDGDTDAYFYDMNEFFKTTESGKFVHDADVDKFLDALTTQKKFPFAEEYRDELKHTLWMVGSDVPTRSAKALVKKLEAHPVFSQYKIISAFGNNADENDENSKALDDARKNAYKAVIDAIAKYDRTITVSVGKLTTGITVPEWTGVMMLSNTKSASLYMQTVFRAQNPCLFEGATESYRKETCYVFDFDPARTLNMYEQFANDLYSDTSSGRGDTETRTKHVRELLNFFPVYGEDEEGEMIELDAEKVLTIPRAIHAKEVVRKGFMSNFLFQNISGIFAAPSVVQNIINKFDAVKEPVKVTNQTAEDLNINEEGEVEIPEQTIIGTAQDVFGDKIYGDVVAIESDIQSVFAEKEDQDTINLDKLKEIVHAKVQSDIETAKDSYGSDLSKSRQNALSRDINREADAELEKQIGKYTINKNTIEVERKEAVEKALQENRASDVETINKEFEQKQKQNDADFMQDLLEVGKKVTTDSKKTIVAAIEKDKREAEKKDIESQVRDHLRGFSRTIPSFLMGYGDENTTLESFDKVIPEEVFLEVTGITTQDFIFLRDGGDYPDPDDATKMKHFDGNLFEPIVFNDSIKEFLRKRDLLADYFKEDVTEDIFDYIPPQKTNQIFTPKKVVKQMVDYLEQENPNCFDNPDATFIDLYMKSGLYITEIVKRLYRNEKMIELFPNAEERLQHIFSKQVFGLAPTEIIYAIATHYILGFAQVHGMSITSKHFKLCDTLPYTQGKTDITLEEKLDELFGNDKPEVR